VEPIYAQWIKSADGVGVSGQTALDDLRKELTERKASN
jgi:hypothetical protein